MEQAVQQLVENMGVICEKEGMPRSAGRILGLLLAEDGPFSLDEISERLQVSKASASTNARMLEQFGMIQRVGSFGDRRDFYRIQNDPWERMLLAAQGRWHDMVRVFSEAQAAFPTEMEAGIRRLEEAERFHALLITECDALLERWRELRVADRAAEGTP